MKVEMNTANVNKVDDAKEKETKDSVYVEMGALVGKALIDVYNKMIDEHGSVKVADILTATSAGVSSFLWKMLDEYKRSERYAAMRVVCGMLYDASRKRIYDDVDED